MVEMKTKNSVILAMNFRRTIIRPDSAVQGIPQPRAADVEDVAAQVLRPEDGGSARQQPTQLVA